MEKTQTEELQCTRANGSVELESHVLIVPFAQRVVAFLGVMWSHGEFALEPGGEPLLIFLEDEKLAKYHVGLIVKRHFTRRNMKVHTLSYPLPFIFSAYTSSTPGSIFTRLSPNDAETKSSYLAVSRGILAPLVPLLRFAQVVCGEEEVK